jgi:cytoskeletal protein CcmA (bactofilin family)
MRKYIAGFAFIVLCLVSGQNIALAREILQGDECIIRSNETIQGNLFVLCRTLQIRGRIQGDLIGAVMYANISGAVTGDVYLLMGQLDITGTLGEDLQTIGPVLRLRRSARMTGNQADVLSLTLSSTIDEGVHIPGTLTAAGYQLLVNGETDGEISFWGSALQLSGRAKDDVYAVVGGPESTGISQLQTIVAPFSRDIQLVNPGLVVRDKGIIEGDLSYSSSTEGDVQGRVKGKTNFTQIVSQPDFTQIINTEDESGLRLFLLQALRDFLILGLIGITGLAFAPKQFHMPLRSIINRPWASLGAGLLALILSFPIVIVTLLIILLLIVLPLILLQFDGLFTLLITGLLMGSWGGFTGLFYFTAIFVSRAIVSLLVGRTIVRLSIGDDGSQRIAILGLIVGTVLISILVSLPVIGIIISTISAFFGLGALLITLQVQLRHYRERLYGPPASRLVQPTYPSYRTSSSHPLPPPLIEDIPAPPGMHNLPEGFTWWDD